MFLIFLKFIFFLNLELWNQVWEWNEIIPNVLLTQILEKYFFPKWIQTLVIWLNQQPNLDQVSRWYSGWKNLFSADIVQQPGISDNFRRALELMHRSSGLTVPQNVVPSEAPQKPPPLMQQQQQQAPPALMDLQISPPPQLDFKEMVSQKCAERGIIFVPVPGRRENGKQIYRAGKIFCYIDRSMIMASDGSFSNFHPISVSSLLERALSGTIY